MSSSSIYLIESIKKEQIEMTRLIEERCRIVANYGKNFAIQKIEK